MKKLLFLTAMIFATVAGFGQSKDEAAIRKVLDRQTEAWNRGDLEAFMEGYWKSDSLVFIGKSGVNRGWQKTLDNYKKGYPDKTAMGQLEFDILEVRRISSDHYYVIGKWTLRRSIGDLTGHYDLLWKKIRGKWVIVADHSS